MKSASAARSFTTNNCLLVALTAFVKAIIVFVFGVSIVPSRTRISPLATLADKADLRARFLTFLLTFFSYDLGWGPNVTPPPTICGALIVPCLALPVPFCLKGFLPPPLTIALVLVAAVPCLAAANSAVNTSWSTAWLGSIPNTESLTSTVPVCVPAKLYMFKTAIIFLLPHLLTYYFFTAGLITI